MLYYVHLSSEGSMGSCELIRGRRSGKMGCRQWQSSELYRSCNISSLTVNAIHGA